MRDTVNAHRQTNPTLISYMQRYQVYVAYNDQAGYCVGRRAAKGKYEPEKRVC